MDIESASNFLVGSILFGLGFVILAIAVVTINNIIAKYWKPVRVFTSDSWTLFGHERTYFMSDEEYKKISPHLEDVKPNDKK